METQLINTSDGSHSVYSYLFDAAYHSKHGAIIESNHIFIEAGLKYAVNKFRNNVNLLEVGFGTGLNALLTACYCKRFNVPVHYTGFEKYPLPISIINALNYPDLVPESGELFKNLHLEPCGAATFIHPLFSLQKIHADFAEAPLQNSFHLVYFDAFAPESCPQLWTFNVFKKIHDVMAKDGALVTFCAKGEVKRTLKKVGFVIESLQGPPRKREMVRAIKLN